MNQCCAKSALKNLFQRPASEEASTMNRATKAVASVVLILYAAATGRVFAEPCASIAVGANHKEKANGNARDGPNRARRVPFVSGMA